MKHTVYSLVKCSAASVWLDKQKVEDITQQWTHGNLKPVESKQAKVQTNLYLHYV